jgi:hypothetical protein
VTYLTWTEDNLLRQVSYQAQREAKPARQVVRPESSSILTGSSAATSASTAWHSPRISSSIDGSERLLLSSTRFAYSVSPILGNLDQVQDVDGKAGERYRFEVG